MTKIVPNNMTDKTHDVLVSWRRALLPASATVQMAIRNLDESSLQVSLVVSEDDTLLGTLTDGDIRRGLLRGLDMNSPVHQIINREPLVTPPQLSRGTVIQLMQANKVHQLPVVDDHRRVVGLHIFDELMAPRERSNTMIIMAGGEGKRLRPYTEHCPKPLLPINGKPMLEHIIERAKLDGVRNFVIAVRYLGYMIEDYFGTGSRWQVHIDYLHEMSPLGTAGAISLLTPKPELPLLVSNGDVLTDIRFGELLDFHSRHAAIATMAVRMYEWQHPFGIVHTQGVDIVGFEEKPIARHHVNAGIYVLEPEALNSLNLNEECDMPTLFTRLHERAARTIVYPMHEPWMDVGRAGDLKAARESMRESSGVSGK